MLFFSRAFCAAFAAVLVLLMHPAAHVPYLGNAQELVPMIFGYLVYCIVTWYFYTRRALRGKAARVSTTSYRRYGSSCRAAARRERAKFELEVIAEARKGAKVSTKKRVISYCNRAMFLHRNTDFVAGLLYSSNSDCHFACL
jgi:hypothetical protein